MKIIELEETDSTNEYCKRIDDGQDLIAVAKRQTSGKGTKGRSFSSVDGGLYVSVMRHYSDLSAKDAFKIMVNACVAVCKTLEYFGLKPQIRWANDVLVGGKKICGTLIENTFSGGNISRSIVGMGINVCNQLPNELKDIAVSMQDAANTNFAVAEVKTVLLKNLEKGFAISDYKKYIDWFNRKITIKTAQEEITAVALDVAEDGRLIAEIDGQVLKISSAEVSLRL